MTASTNDHRNPCGTIDFDHYRRLAAQMRAKALRETVRGAAGALGHALAATIAPLRRTAPASRPAASSR